MMLPNYTRELIFQYLKWCVEQAYHAGLITQRELQEELADLALIYY